MFFLWCRANVAEARYLECSVVRPHTRVKTITIALSPWSVEYVEEEEEDV